ncbi:CSL zinc finger domain-containing protein [Quillaja saponaria]|uniref:CSL zinc finger domain-containing protein n=1 Tax=Quillaja saponaria TaxID=32244 RepID=A0AAD7M1L6_QUISA|nr:CSL zinc finger domain-containing protein [Quillaja saponaria]
MKSPSLPSIAAPSIRYLVDSGLHLLVRNKQQEHYQFWLLTILTISSFTLFVEFQEGTLQNLCWKNFGCDACSGDSFVCLNNQDCAVPTSKRKRGGNIECNIGIQLTFSGTHKNLNALNSWYEVENLRQYSLYGLYSDLRDPVGGQYDKLI